MTRFLCGFGLYILIGVISQIAIIVIDFHMDQKNPGMFDADTPSKEWADEQESNIKEGFGFDINSSKGFLIAMIVSILGWPLNLPMCMMHMLATWHEYKKMK